MASNTHQVGLACCTPTQEEVYSLASALPLPCSKPLRKRCNLRCFYTIQARSQAIHEPLEWCTRPCHERLATFGCTLFCQYRLSVKVK
jgi:hypothetical protein